MSSLPSPHGDPVPIRLPAPAGAVRGVPAQRNPLLGRERELEQVQALLRNPEVRWLTLTGPGGAGKSRLAQEVATNLASTFPDGIVFVPLAAVRDPALALPTIAQALDLPEIP